MSEKISLRVYAKEAVFFVLAAVCVNTLFYYYGTNHAYYSPDPMHGEVGYNVYNFNVITRNSELGAHLAQLKKEGTVPLSSNRMVDPVHAQQLFAPTGEYNAITDTVGYGVLLGLIWKLTGSLRYRDVQFVQIGMLSLLMLLIYGLAMMLFGNVIYARCVSLCFLFFFPLMSLNVQVLRDIWAYYGVLVLLFFLMYYFVGKKSLWYVCCAAVFFSLCQWIRPTIALALITLPAVFGIATLFGKFTAQRFFKAFTLVFIVNVCVFWLPFMVYNKIAYDRYLVGPVGQDLIEGLGEFPNRWGYQLSDSAFITIITEKYHPNKPHGTPEFDDYGIIEFKKAYAQDPWFYFSTLVRRIPQIIFPALPFIFHDVSSYEHMQTITDKIVHSFSSIDLFIDFICRHIFVRLLLLIGYIGMLYMLKDRQWFALALLFFGVMCIGYGKFPSHIEYRYLTPFYWPIIFFASYALCRLYTYAMGAGTVNKKA